MENKPAQITVKVLRAFYFGGAPVKAGTIATYERAFASELIATGKAKAHDGKTETAAKTAEEPKK